jgi:7,8-dihydropterin-6-yl-methyl-4-(beta-D-ribofuranosyl)aminobenzene 5'-phosphate synthase
MKTSPKIKISVLCDDQAKMTSTEERFLAQHGLSIWIEAGVKILFDVGATDVFLHNADILGIDIASVDFIILSHGHWDHADGLKYMPGMMGKKPLIVHPGAFVKRCKGSGGHNGMPFDVTTASTLFHVIPSTEPYQITNDLFFLGEIPRINGFEALQTAFFYYDGEEKHPDMIHDDSALAITSETGLIIITGCSHAGICNIVEHAKKITGQCEIRMVIGGFHLRGNEAQLQGTLNYFLKNNVQEFYPMHCNDLAALCAFRSAFGAKRLCAGDVLTID